MSVFDYVLDAVLILLVVLQLRGNRFGPRTVLLPLLVAGVVGGSYLRGLPTGGDDLAFIAVLTAAGALLGLASGVTTRVWHDGRAVMVRAGVASAAIWVIGMAGRAVFQIWVNGSGATAVAQFSYHHSITSSAAWVDALVLMALAQVVVRVAVISGRAALAARSGRVVLAAA